VTVFVSLLRAVNVGGHGKIQMAALRALYADLGFEDVASYVQSGNLVFRSRARDPRRVAKTIEDGIEARFGFRPPVMIRTAAEMAQVAAENPFAGRAEVESKQLMVTFLTASPTQAAAKRLAGVRRVREELVLRGRELYVWFPDGIGRSKLSGAAIEKALGTAGTGRNWNTVTKLLELTQERT